MVLDLGSTDGLWLYLGGGSCLQQLLTVGVSRFMLGLVYWV